MSDLAPFRIRVGEAWQWSTATRAAAPGAPEDTHAPFAPSAIVDFFALEVGGARLPGSACEDAIALVLADLVASLVRLAHGAFTAEVAFRLRARRLVLARGERDDALLLTLVELGRAPAIVVRDLPVAWSELRATVLAEGRLLRGRLDARVPGARAWTRALSDALALLESTADTLPPLERVAGRAAAAPHELHIAAHDGALDAGAPLRALPGGEVAARLADDPWAHAEARAFATVRPDAWMRAYSRGGGSDTLALLAPGALRVAAGSERFSASRDGAPVLLLLRALLVAVERRLRTADAAAAGAPAPSEWFDGWLVARTEGGTRPSLRATAIALGALAESVVRSLTHTLPALGAHPELTDLAAHGAAARARAEQLGGVSAPALAPRVARNGASSGPRPTVLEPGAPRPLARAPQPTPATPRARRALVRELWRHDGHGLRLDDALAGAHRVLLPTATGLVALRADDGAVAWRRPTVRGLVPSGALLVGARDSGCLVGFEPATGRVAWSRRHADLVAGTTPAARHAARVPRVSAGADLVLDAGHGALLAVASTTGVPVWRHLVAGASALVVAADARHVWVASDTGEVLGLSSARGQRLWRVRVSGAVTQAPVVTRGRVLVATSFGTTAGGQLVCLDASRGRVAWEHSLGLSIDRPVRCDAGVAYVASRVETHAQLGAIELSSGARLWTHELECLGPRGLSTPVLVRDLVCVTTDDHRVYALDRHDGHVRWAFDLERERCIDVSAPPDPVACGELVLVAADALYVLDATTGRAVAVAEPPRRFAASALKVLAGRGRGRAVALVAEDDDRVVALSVRWLGVV